MCKNFNEVEFDGKIFKIAQASGRCCESGCSGCELYAYKLENGIPLENSRAKFYAKFAEHQSKEDDGKD